VVMRTVRRDLLYAGSESVVPPNVRIGAVVAAKGGKRTLRLGPNIQTFAEAFLILGAYGDLPAE
jgi:hypothetical protein